MLPMTLATLATIASTIMTAPYLAVEARILIAAVLIHTSADQFAHMPK
jgi:hypothetical protein